MMMIEIIRDKYGKIVRLDKLTSSPGYIFLEVIAANPDDCKPSKYTWAQVETATTKIISAFEGLEKKEPGDIKFLLTLLNLITLASIVQRQNERL